MLLRRIREQKMKTSVILSVGVEKRLSCYGLRISSALEAISSIPCVLVSFRVNFYLWLLKIVWPDQNGSLLILCRKASRDCVIASCASEQGRFAENRISTVCKLALLACTPSALLRWSPVSRYFQNLVQRIGIEQGLIAHYVLLLRQPVIVTGLNIMNCVR